MYTLENKCLEEEVFEMLRKKKEKILKDLELETSVIERTVIFEKYNSLIYIKRVIGNSDLFSLYHQYRELNYAPHFIEIRPTRNEPD